MTADTVGQPSFRLNALPRGVIQDRCYLLDVWEPLASVCGSVTVLGLQ